MRDCGDLQFAIYTFCGHYRNQDGEEERERVPDWSNSSSDEDASDDDGSEQSDGASEAQSGECLYRIVVMVPTSYSQLAEVENITATKSRLCVYKRVFLRVLTTYFFTNTHGKVVVV